MTFLEKLNFDWIEFIGFPERPFRAKFIPSKIFKDLDKYRNDSRGLSNYVKKWRTRVVEKTNRKWRLCMCGGEYGPDERQCVIIIHTQSGYDKYKFTDKRWERFKKIVIQTMMHELIHFKQFDARGDEWGSHYMQYKKTGLARVDKEREYLSNFDEIQAYAHDIYFEVMSSPYKIKSVAEIVKTIKKKETRSPSMSLKYYLKTFGFTTRTNTSIPKLYAQVMKWERKYNKYGI